jgi:hypothetical protein
MSSKWLMKQEMLEQEAQQPEELDEEVTLPAAPPSKNNQTYTVLKGGERLYDVSRKLALSEAELIEHNGLDELDDPYNLPEGYVLHLPMPRQEGTTVVAYDVLSHPLPMHVSKEDGAKKWSFGNVKNWTDVSPSGPTYPFGTNVTIYAVANVPIEGQLAAYYLDQISLGNYLQTGRVAYTTGFNHSHLTEGYLETPPKEIKPEVKKRLDSYNEVLEKMAADAAAEDNRPPEPEPTPIELDPTPEISKWKSSYTPLNDARRPEVYLFNEDVIIHDYAEERPDVFVYRLKGVKIGGTFWKDGKKYYRPQDAVDKFTWYGIPHDKVILRDELYTYDIPLVERVAIHGHLTTEERYVTVPLARLKAYWDKKTNKK